MVLEASFDGARVSGVWSSKKKAQEGVGNIEDQNGTKLNSFGDVTWDTDNDNYGGVPGILMAFRIVEVELDVPNHSLKGETEVAEVQDTEEVFTARKAGT